MSKVFGTDGTERISNVVVTNQATFDGTTTFNDDVVFNGNVDLSAEFVGETLTDGKLSGTTTLLTNHEFEGKADFTGVTNAKVRIAPDVLQNGSIQLTGGANNIYFAETGFLSSVFGYEIKASPSDTLGTNDGLFIRDRQGNYIAIFLAKNHTTGLVPSGTQGTVLLGNVKIDTGDLVIDGDCTANLFVMDGLTDNGAGTITANAIYLTGGAELVDATNVNATTTTTNTLTSTGNLAISAGGGFIDFSSDRVKSFIIAESDSDASMIASDRQSIKWYGLGGGPENINCLRFQATNGTSQCYAFLGQRGAASSMGLAIKNAYSSNIVGFAPSAVSGIEIWSFSAKHQSQYTGTLTEDHKGMVVEATGDVVGLYQKDKMVYGINHDDPNYSNAVPIVRLCTTRKSKAVIGAIKEITDEPDTETGHLLAQWSEEGYEKGDRRVQVNSIGEGLIWVSNANGNIEVGDLLQSSDDAGYAEKQDDDIMRSYTIGKITMACDFVQSQVPVKEIKKDNDGNNVLDNEGRLIWVNSSTTQNKYKMRELPNGHKACLLSCIYYSG